MTQPIVAITRRLPGDLQIPGVELRVGTDEAMTRGDLLRFVRGASAVVSWVSERIDREVLEASGKSLRVVANYAVGYDNIDLEACRERGVIVTNTPHAVTEGTANLAIALMLAVARRVVEADRFIRRGTWKSVLGPTDFLGLDVTGRTMLIVGAGRIGYATALRARALGMQIAYVARSRHWSFELAPLAAQRVELDEGLTRADVVSIHTPLTDETRHLINERRLGLMKPRAILVNTARGPVVDEAALVQALRTRSIWGAGLDVFEDEPRVHPDLLELDNVVLTPHMGSAERRFREEMTRMALENVRAVLDGREPPNRIA